MAMIRVMFGSVGSDGSEEAASHDRQMDEIVGMFTTRISYDVLIVVFCFLDSREGRQGFRVAV